MSRTFLRKGILFHHDFLVPSGAGSGSGACLPTFLSFLFPQTALELNGVLNSCQKRSLFHHDLLFLLVPARVLVLGSLLLSSFFFQEKGSVPS